MKFIQDETKILYISNGLASQYEEMGIKDVIRSDMHELFKTEFRFKYNYKENEICVCNTDLVPLGYTSPENWNDQNYIRWLCNKDEIQTLEAIGFIVGVNNLNEKIWQFIVIGEPGMLY